MMHDTKFLEALRKVYNLPRIKFIEKLRSGFGSKKYHLKTSEEEYCLRINLPFFSDDHSAELRGNVLRYISQRINTPYPINTLTDFESDRCKCKEQSTYFKFDNKCAELYSWSQKSKNVRPSKRLIPALESLLVALSDASKRVDQVPAESNQKEIAIQLNKLEFLSLTHLCKSLELDKFQEHYTKHRSAIYLAQRDTKRMPSSLVHGDCHLGNFAQDSKGRIIIFDFESLRFGHPIEDISWFIEDYLFKANSKNPKKLLDEVVNLVGENHNLRLPNIYFYLLSRRMQSYEMHLLSNLKSERTPIPIIQKHRRRINKLIEIEDLFLR